MKINELKKIAEENDYEYKKDDGQHELIRRLAGNYIIISDKFENKLWVKNMSYCDDKDFNMIKASVEFAETSFEDREEEKKFYLTTKEFVKNVRGYGYLVEDMGAYYTVYNELGYLLASVSKVIRCEFNCYFKKELDRNLFCIIVDYAVTPIEDREEKTYRYEVFCEIDIKAKSKEEAIRKLEKDYGNYFSTYVGVVNEDGEVKEVEE